MPVLETDFLKGLIDPKDGLHDCSLRALERVRDGKWRVASSAFLELDLLLKGEGVPRQDRKSVFEAFEPEIPTELIVPLTPRVLAEAIKIGGENPDIPHFYFDSIHIGTALVLDRRIVSSDSEFDGVKGVERIPLEEA